MAHARLDTLPSEILLDIGSRLDKPSSLILLMSVNKRLRDFTLEHMDTLIIATLGNFILPELLPAAITVFQASHVRSWTPEITQNIVSQFRGGRYIKKARLSLEDALKMQRVHEKILSMEQEFVALSLAQRPKVLVEPKPLSISEKLRVERSFYLFEMIVKIFHQNILDRDSTCRRQVASRNFARPSVKHVFLFLLSREEHEQVIIITEFVQETNHKYMDKWEWDLTTAWRQESSKIWTERVLTFFSVPSLQQSVPACKHKSLNYEWAKSTNHTRSKTQSSFIVSYGGTIPPDTDKGPKNASKWAYKLIEGMELRKRRREDYLGQLITLEHRRAWGYALWDEERLRTEGGMIGTVEQDRYSD